MARLMRGSAVPPDAVPDVRPDPADPALLTSPDITSARVAGGCATPAFGYPAFAPADSGGFEFRSQSWHLGEAGFEQIGDAEVIRRGLAQRPPAPSAGWDPLTDPLPATAGRLAHRPEADTQAWDPAAEHTQPIELWATLAEPLDEQRTQPVDLSALFRPEPDRPGDHPSGPLPAAGVWPPVAAVPDSPAGWLDAAGSADYDATLAGPLGSPELGFRGGKWYSLLASSARPVSTFDALRSHPLLAGQITQLVCWWIRRNPMSDRALDLASELAIGVAELARGEAHQHI
ncbi:MAG TPA: hypothetical protein VHV82_16315 [Sporichthyaceae bacterium]|nr:hypothetical protein [Sporichthyaceae bacterium]